MFRQRQATFYVLNYIELTLYTSRQLTKDQYSEGVFLLKSRPKQDSDESFDGSKWLEQLMQLKRRKSSPTK